MKNRCADITACLVDYIGGELSPQEANVVNEHIASCTACRNEYQALCSVHESVKRSPLIQVPDAMHHRIHLALEQEVTKSLLYQISHIWKKPAFSATLAILLLTIVLFAVFMPGRRQQDSTQSILVAESEIITGTATAERDLPAYLERTAAVIEKLMNERAENAAVLYSGYTDTTKPGWNVRDAFMNEAAMAMKHKDGLDTATDKELYQVLEDVEQFWRYMHDAADEFAAHSKSLRDYIQQKQLIGRIYRIIE